VVAAVIGALWLGESVSLQDTIGVVLAVLSILLIAR
jgi:drug/metabolite transporter (DMT)-like permease